MLKKISGAPKVRCQNTQWRRTVLNGNVWRLQRWQNHAIVQNLKKSAPMCAASQRDDVSLVGKIKKKTVDFVISP